MQEDDIETNAENNLGSKIRQESVDLHRLAKTFVDLVKIESYHVDYNGCYHHEEFIVKVELYERTTTQDGDMNQENVKLKIVISD